ncbi:MAG TPA: cytochrome c [Myxococcota bacterium]|jgi:mono/diheme cytochrome c family protein
MSSPQPARRPLLFAATALAALSCSEPAPPAGGAELFAKHCASCHGASGAGDGPLAAELRVAPANLRGIARRNGGKFDEDAVARTIDGRRAVAAHGPRDMPVWGDEFESEFAAEGAPRPAATAVLRAQLLTDYLKTLQDE